MPTRTLDPWASLVAVLAPGDGVRTRPTRATGTDRRGAQQRQLAEPGPGQMSQIQSGELPRQLGKLDYNIMKLKTTNAKVADATLRRLSLATRV